MRRAIQSGEKDNGKTKRQNTQNDVRKRRP